MAISKKDYLEAKHPRWQQRQEKQKENNKDFTLLRRVIFYFLVILFVLVCFYVFFLSPFMNIETVIVDGAEEINNSELESVIEQKTTGKYLWLFPKNNYFFVFNKGLEKVLMQQFKKIETIESKKTFPNKIEFKIKERRALLMICSGGPCFMVDNKGIAYASADFESDEVKQNHLIQIIDESSKPIEIGNKVVNEDFLNYVSEVRNEMEKNGFTLTEQFITPSRVSNEFFVTDTRGIKLLFSIDYPLNNAITMLKTAINKEIKKENLERLEYVDLRTENKIFYKFK